MKGKNKKILLFAVVIIMSSILAYAGHFLFSGFSAAKDKEQGKAEATGQGRTGEQGPGPAQNKNGEKSLPVKYTHLSRTINNLKQEMDLVEVDISSGKARILPVLSHDLLFGFEKLSSMVSRSGAYAAVNAGFFYEYGEPAGMVAINGVIATNPSGRYPVFISNGKKASLEEVSMHFSLKSSTAKLTLDKINNYGASGEAVLYTPLYGKTNRAKGPNLSVRIVSGKAAGAKVYEGEADIPEAGMLLSFYEPFRYDKNSIPFAEGEDVELTAEPALGAGADAYQCGSWVVRDGRIVVPDADEWVGTLLNRDPRTAIGIRSDGTVVLFTADGRQPGYSEGLTGRELGAVLLELGVRDAAMLDGGASTEMIVGGRMVNRPSFKGQERPLGGAVAVIVSD